MHPSIVTVAVFFVFGICLGRRFPLALPLSWTLLFLGLAGLVALRRRWGPGGRTRALLLVVVLAGAHRLHQDSPSLRPDHAVHEVGRPEGEHRLLVLSGADGGRRASLRLMGRTTSGGWHLRPGLVEAAWFGGGRPELRAGEVLEGRGRLVNLGTVTGRSGPVAGRSRRGRIRLAFRPAGMLRVVGRRPVEPIRSRADAFRRRASAAVGQVFTAESAPVVRAMLLGERDELDGTVRRNFRRSGSLHLLSQSGLHVGVLALAVYGTARVLRLGMMPSSILTALFLLAFCLVVGARAPVMRATLMALLMLGGRVLRRPVSPFATLAVAALILLAWDPLSLFEAGFQLSFLAVISILYLWPVLSDWLSRVPDGLNALLSVSVAAWLGTLPILLHHGGEISLVAPLANVFLVPLAGVALPCMLLAVLAAMINPWLGFFFAAAAHGFLELILLVADWASRPAWAHVEDLDVAPFWLLLHYALLIFLGDAVALRERLGKGFRRSWVRRSGPDLAFLDGARWTGSRDVARVFAENAPAVAAHLRRFEGRWAEELELTGERHGPIWRDFGSETRDLLTFAATWLKDEERSGAVPAVAAWTGAIELELHRRLFVDLERAMRGWDPSAREGLPTWLAERIEVSASGGILPLQRQVEFLWLLVTGSEERTWVRGAIRHLRDRFADPAFVLDEARLPLRLDEVARRLHRNLRDEPSRETLQALQLDFGGVPGTGLLSSLVTGLGLETGGRVVEGTARGRDADLPEASDPTGDGGNGLAPGLAGMLVVDGDGKNELPLG